MNIRGINTLDLGSTSPAQVYFSFSTQDTECIRYSIDWTAITEHSSQPRQRLLQIADRPDKNAQRTQAALLWILSSLTVKRIDSLSANAVKKPTFNATLQRVPRVSLSHHHFGVTFQVKSKDIGITNPSIGHQLSLLGSRSEANVSA